MASSRGQTLQRGSASSSKNEDLPEGTASGTMSSFEQFICCKLTEGVKKKSYNDASSKKHKRVSNVGEILTSPEAFKRLEISQCQKKTSHEPKDTRQAQKGKPKQIVKGTKKKKIVSKSSSSDEASESTSDDTNRQTPRAWRPELLLEKYYAVYYDDRWYLGRLIDFYDEDSSKIKFLKEELDVFKWPARDD